MFAAHPGAIVCRTKNMTQKRRPAAFVEAELARVRDQARHDGGDEGSSTPDVAINEAANLKV